MPMTPQAAKLYKPRRTPGSVEDVVRSEEKQKMLDEARDAKMMRESDKSYEAARTTFKKGGSASSRADGIAKRGKTRGKMVMCYGGKT